MKGSKFAALLATIVLATSQLPTAAYAGPEDRQDRREERGRSDERQDRRDCRREEGAVGQDKRECKQEEVRDGARGHRGESADQDDKDQNQGDSH